MLDHYGFERLNIPIISPDWKIKNFKEGNDIYQNKRLRVEPFKHEITYWSYPQIP